MPCISGIGALQHVLGRAQIGTLRLVPVLNGPDEILAQLGRAFLGRDLVDPIFPLGICAASVARTPSWAAGYVLWISVFP
jgi:hypothetical protein